MTWLLESALINAILATVLACVAAAVTRWGRRPALGHALWLLVLIKLVTPPLVELPIHVTIAERSENALAQGLQALARPAPEAAGVVPLRETAAAAASEEVAARPTEVTPTRANAAPIRADFQIRPVAVLYALWGLGCLGLLIFVCRRIRRFATAVREADRSPIGLQERADSLARDMGLLRSPQVRLMDAHVSPMLWGCGPFASIILPHRLIDELTEPEVDALLAHELAHFRRGDHWVRVLELVVGALFWWHPVVWWARREIERCEEECCDAWVVGRFPNYARDYAEALLSTIEFISERRAALPPVASGMADVPAIERRLRQIMIDPVPRTVSRAARVWLVVSAIALPMQPVLTAVPATSVMAATFANRPFAVRRIPIATPDEPGSLADLRDIDLSPTPELLNSPIYQTVPAQSEYASAESSDGRYRITAELGRRVTLRDTLSGRAVDLSPFRITTVAFLDDGTRFLAGAQDGSVRVWSTETGAPTSFLGSHNAAVKSLDVAPDGHYVVTGAADGSVYLWRMGTETVEAIPLDVVGGINCVRFSPDGRAIAVAAGSWQDRREPLLVLYDLLNGGIAQAIATDAPVAAAQFDSTGTLTTLGWDGRAVEWDLSTGAAVGAGAVPREAVALANFSSRNHVTIEALSGPVASAIGRDGQLQSEEFAP